MSCPKNPWKDFASYKSTDARYFKGREESIAKFLRIVDADTMSVLYASSGIGKTSFIQAGIVPIMMERGYAPIQILFNDDDFAEGVDLSMLLKLHVEDEVKKHNENEDKIKKEKKKQNEDYTTNKWGWNSLLDVQSEEIGQLIKDLDKVSLWWKFHTCEIRTESGQSLKPLLLLDQFEEIFVKAKAKNIQLQTFFDELEELASNNLPSEVETILNQLANQGVFFDLDTYHHYKIIFSLRKEYLSDFDYWTNDRHSIAELQQNRMLLLPLSRNKAMKVIIEQPLNLDGSKCYTTLNNIAEEILNVIDDKKRNEIEPFILSVLCSRLYDRSVGLGKTELKPEDLNTYSANTIIREFYEQKMQSIIPKHSHITRIEEELIDEDGKRGRVKVKRLKDIEFEKRYKKELEDAHLVRIDNYNGEDYIELVHDRVADAIMERRKESTKKNRLVVARIASFIAIFFLFFITYWIQTIPTSNNIFPYQLKYEDGNGNHVNFSGDSIHGDNIVAINCHNLKTIVVDSCNSATIKVRGCDDLRNVFMSDYCGNLVLDLDNCPLLNPIKIPSSVYRLSFSNIPPNNLSFHTEEKGNYVWKDNILWDKRDTTIIYARYDAPINVTPPFNTGKNYFIYKTRPFNNEEKDTILLTGYNSKYEIDSIRVSKYSEVLDLHDFKISSTRDWEMSKFSKLLEIILPDSLSYISAHAFAKCKKLRHVTFPSKLQGIGAGAFEGCSSLNAIDFPCSLRQIDGVAFRGCTSIEKVSLPDSVQVHLSSFDGCTKLETVKLPNYFQPVSMKYPDFMFKNCPNIKKFEFDSSSNHYTVEDDGTIVYTGIKFNDGIVPLLLLNTVNNHSYSSGEFVVKDSVPPYHFFSKGGALYYGNKNGSELINNPREDIKSRIQVLSVSANETSAYIPLTHREVFLTGILDSLKELHFPYVDESKLGIIDLPLELKRNIVLFVPYGSISYFTGLDILEVSEWRGIKEENRFSWLCTIIAYHFKTGLDVVNQWGWFWPVIIIVVILIAALITYLYRRKESGIRASGDGLMKFLFNFMLTIVVGIFTWYTFYWFIFLTSYHFWGNTILTEIFVDALLSACLAILFIYVVLYSKGFNLKGFVDACKKNIYALWNGLVDVCYTIKNLSWNSVRQSLKGATERLIIRAGETFRKLRYGILRMFSGTYAFIRQSMHKFTAKPIGRKTLIFYPLIVILILLYIFFARGHEVQNRDGEELVDYCKLLIEDSTITDKQVIGLRDRLIKSISIKDMETIIFDKDPLFSPLGDSIFIVVERDSCHYYDFARMKYGHVNFDNSMSEVHKGEYSLSEVHKFIYHIQEDSVYIWPKHDLEQKPFKVGLSNSNKKITWFAHDKYVGIKNGDDKYVIFDTKEWNCVAEVIGGEGKRIAKGILVTRHPSVDKSEAFIYDGDLKLTKYTFDGEFKGCFDNKFLISRIDETYMLYNLTDGSLLDKKRSDRTYDFPDFSYGYSSPWRSDSTYVIKVIDNQINFDVIPYKVEITSSKYVCYIQNDSTMIYHIPTNRTYNLGYSVKCSCQDSIVAINDKHHIAVYYVSDSIKLLRENIPAGSSYSLYMYISNNFLTLDDTKTLFRYNADSLGNTKSLNDDVTFVGWYCKSEWKKEYYSLEYYDDGFYDPRADIKSSILRGGWCFVTTTEGYKLDNIKSTKRLIRESLYLDDQTKESLCRLYDEYNEKNLK